ncbi:hypothetical protein CNMCM8980_002641 [Aspergillus fumigatiaffinis]|nr:hypothetical protein CNMCM8980_002641 [Aspergillus fumigatiaffinis]
MMPEKAGNVNESPGALSDLSRPGEGGEVGGQQAMCGRVIEGGGGETAVITICLLYVNAPTLILLWVEYSSALYQRNFDQSLVLGTDDIAVVTFEPAVIQRVKSASVTVNEKLVSSIGRGLLVLAGVGKEDTEKDADTLIQRILKAKLWPAEEGGQWKRNVQDIEGEVLCVSQFTLYGQLKKGSKPDFHDAADAETARKLYDYFFRRLGEAYKPDRVKNGVFQAMMDVELKNDGPVGVDYRSEDAAVTIEINTKLAKEKKPAEGQNKPQSERKDGETQTFEFELPASLLE